jgi:hypothetical protein
MKFLAALAAIILSSAAATAASYRTESVMLLQPDFVLEERVPSVDSLSEYIKAVQLAAESALAGEDPHPTSGYLVLAVRPGGRSMVWLDFEPDLPESIQAKLRTAILAVPAFEARGGVVVFALNSSLWGSPAAQGFPNPEEWSKAMEGHTEPMEIGDLVDRVWPPAVLAPN